MGGEVVPGEVELDELCAVEHLVRKHLGGLVDVEVPTKERFGPSVTTSPGASSISALPARARISIADRNFAK
jgi:hypothetical protein